MARPPNTSARREQIARGLLSVMAEKGYDRATTVDVAEAAELSRGVVHYHFDSKLEILLFLIDLYVAEHVAVLEEHLDRDGGNPVAQVRTFITVHVSAGDAEPTKLMCWIAFGAEALREPSVQKKYQAALALWVERLTQIIRAGIAKKVFKCKPAAASAAGAAIVAAIQGYLHIGATTDYGSVIPEMSGAISVLAMAEGLLGARILERRS